MTAEPKRDQMVWWILFALIVIGIGGGLAWRCQEREDAEDAATRYRQEERDRPGIHELQRDLGER